jgi:hypothetical protein
MSQGMDSHFSEGELKFAEQIGSRIQRDFVAWHRQNAQRFAIPLRLVARNRKQLDLSFTGITAVISARLPLCRV